MSASASRVAQDLSRFDNRPQVRAAAALAEPAIRALPQPHTRARTQPMSHLSIKGTLVFICVMALMFFIVYTYMQMAEMSKASWEIKQQISQLQKEEELLLREKNSLINMQELERIAVEELGMVKPTRSQIIYINLSGEDHAELITQKTTGTSEKTE